MNAKCVANVLQIKESACHRPRKEASGGSRLQQLTAATQQLFDPIEALFHNGNVQHIFTKVFGFVVGSGDTFGEAVHHHSSDFHVRVGSAFIHKAKKEIEMTPAEKERGGKRMGGWMYPNK